MSAISTYLHQIITAIWAKDVRQAIHDAISQCYDDVNAPALQTEAMQAAVQAKIDAGQMAALTIADGSLTGAKLANGTIQTAKIADGAVTAGKLASGAVPTDTTLSQSGIPADAKAAGDAIEGLQDGIVGVVKVTPQSFTDAQKAAARTNIGAIDASLYSGLSTLLDNEISTRESECGQNAEAISRFDDQKVNQPVNRAGLPIYGTYGQTLRTNGDGTTSWADLGLPTSEQVGTAVAAWLAEHPEATTTVEDGAISAEKLASDLTIAKIDNYASPMDYGATGDGEHDDTAAFVAAENSGKGIIYVPKGVYKVSGITTAKSIIMDSEAWLTTDTDKADVLTVTGDYEVYRLNLRLKDTYAHSGITVSGNHNHFEMVNIDGLNYDGVTLYPNNKVNIGLHILGDYNTFDFVKMNDFIQDYAGNESAPQGIAIDKNADCNYIADFNIVNCRSGIVNAGYAGTVNRIGSMLVSDCGDNGLYCVGGGHTEVGTLFYKGTNECLAVITDGATASTPENVLTNVQVGTIICKGDTGFEFPVRIKNAGEIKIGSLFVNGEVNSIIFTNSDTYLNAGIDIGNLVFDGSAKFAFYLPASRGVLRYLTIGRAMIKDNHSNTALDLTANSGNYLIVDMAQKLSIDRLDLAIADKDGVYSGKTLHPRMILNSALADSFIGRISCQNLSNANSVRLDIINAIQDSLTQIYGYFQYNDTENKVSIYHNNNYSDKLYSRLTPQYGTWKVGATVYTDRTQNINEGVVGWVCIQAGTPGLWREVKVWPYAGAVRYEGGNLQYYNASTGSWTGVSV